MTPAESLRTSAFEIIEEQLFLFLDETDPTDDAPIRYTMRIALDGKDFAEIGMSSSEGSARALAANVLGIGPDEIGDAEETSAIAEALNMVAGKILYHVHGGDLELELCPPIAGGQPRGDVVAFHTDGGTLQLWYAT